MGRISPLTWSAIQTFLASVGSGQYRAMAVALTQMGATSATVDVDRFAADLRKIFESVQVRSVDCSRVYSPHKDESIDIDSSAGYQYQRIIFLQHHVIRCYNNII